MAKHVAYKEKFEVEAEEAHRRVQQLGSLKWFRQGGVPPPPPNFFPPRTFQFSFGPTLGVSFLTC